VFRLLRGLKQNGATSLLSKRRGRPSNHRLPDEVRTLALSIVRCRIGGEPMCKIAIARYLGRRHRYAKSGVAAT
jgi:hypothetical protein